MPASRSVNAFVWTAPVFILLAACEDSANTFTLYRSPLTPMRIHVATFDVEGEAPGYNRGNCEMVVRYLEQQPEVPQGYYWCERGRFKP